MQKKNVRDFLEVHKKFLGIDLAQLEFEGVDKSEPFKHVTYRQHFGGIPVVGRSVTVHLIENNVDEGDIIGYSASFDPKVFIEDPEPLFLREEGITKAHNALGKISDYRAILKASL